MDMSQQTLCLHTKIIPPYYTTFPDKKKYPTGSCEGLMFSCLTNMTCYTSCQLTSVFSDIIKWMNFGAWEQSWCCLCVALAHRREEKWPLSRNLSRSQATLQPVGSCSCKAVEGTLGRGKSVAKHIFRGGGTQGRCGSGKTGRCSSCRQVLGVERPPRERREFSDPQGWRHVMSEAPLRASFLPPH